MKKESLEGASRVRKKLDFDEEEPSGKRLKAESGPNEEQKE